MCVQQTVLFCSVGLSLTFPWTSRIANIFGLVFVVNSGYRVNSPEIIILINYTTAAECCPLLALLSIPSPSLPKRKDNSPESVLHLPLFLFLSLCLFCCLFRVAFVWQWFTDSFNLILTELHNFRWSAPKVTITLDVCVCTCGCMSVCGCVCDYIVTNIVNQSDIRQGLGNQIA